MTERHLQSSPTLAGRLRPLAPDQVRELTAAVERVFRPHENPPHHRVDISDATADEVRALLTDWGLETALACQLVWRADHEGVELEGATFVRHYDDLWYPARDDVWVTDPQRSWLLSIDHEELLEHWGQRSASPPTGEG